MKFSNFEFIERWEGNGLPGKPFQSYKDTGGVWTIGYGHTGKEVGPNQKITKEKAIELFKKDIAWAEGYVNDAVKVKLTQNQFDALTSFVYNVGPGKVDGKPPGFLSSTALKRLNAGDYNGAAEALTWWNKVGSKVIPGLVNRRKAEKELFLTPDVKEGTEERIREAIERFVSEIKEILNV